jgi:hypothetical protein
LVQALTQGLRLAQSFLDYFFSKLWWIIATPAMKWLDCWKLHRSTILFLALVNTSLTTVSEISSRTVISILSESHNEAFIVKSSDGRERVHRQSLINIVMTLIASLLGGPVFFITSRLNRFVFFISFGTINSLLSQALSTYVMEGVALVLMRRLVFDFAYNASVKFILFEFVRPFLLRHRDSASKVLAFRVGQDFMTTSLRVLILKILKLSGQ